MATPNVLVLRAPGTNCDLESEFAFELAGAKANRIHINELLENASLVDRHQILCLPGGFSYGDDISAGKILATQMHSRLHDRICEFRDAGKLILGICNGFQVLLRSGFLFTESKPTDGPQATLTWNENGRFEDRWVHLRVRNDHCAFLRGIDRMYLPIAHAEGKFVTANAQVLEQLMQSDQLALRYVNPDGSNSLVPFPFNPNGSQADVAGMCDPTGRIFGLMPHPERHIHPTHHPRWTREGLQEKGDGCQIFENAVSFFS